VAHPIENQQNVGRAHRIGERVPCARDANVQTALRRPLDRLGNLFHPRGCPIALGWQLL
jgi:hypothetical protein